MEPRNTRFRVLRALQALVITSYSIHYTKLYDERPNLRLDNIRDVLEDFVDASLIKADASRYTKVEATEWSVPEQVTRATQEYLDTLDDAAFGSATPVQPKTLVITSYSIHYTKLYEAYCSLQ